MNLGFRQNENMTPHNKASVRMMCIDAFRGMTIASMLFMENPGNPEHVSDAFRHAPWDGLTYADLGFPFFIFIAGTSLPFAVKKRLERGDSKLKIFLHLLYRSVFIFIIGLFLNGFPNFNFEAIRWTGALERIAVVYLLAGVLTLWTDEIVQAALSISLLIVYCLLLKYVSVPGFGKGILSQNGNLVQYVDMMLLKGHMYTPAWDPEGIMSTIPSISTILFGVLAGQILISKSKTWVYKLMYLLVGGSIGMAFGIIISGWFPINKNLWSASFALYTGGLAFIIIGICYLIIDVIGHKELFKPFLVLGGSAITIYFGFEIVVRTLWRLKIVDTAANLNLPLYVWLTNKYFTPWAGIYDSYYFSIAYTFLWVLIICIFKRADNR